MKIASQTLPSSSLTALTEAAAAIGSTLDLGQVLTKIARLACEVTRAEVGCLFSIGSTGKELTVLAATGHWREALIGKTFDIGSGVPGEVVRSGEPRIVVDASRYSGFSREIDDLSSMRTHSLIAAPMINRGHIVGVIEVVNRRDGSVFTETDLKVLTLFATFATSASQNARKHEDLQEQLAGLRQSVSQRDVIIGESAPWQRVIDLCNRVATSNATVLLLGETGTGKELTARCIHNASRCRQGPLVAVNCAAVPEALLESELFGHEKGAFTGAHSQRRGWFEVAQGGTIFLDEIGDVSRPMQAKLLRVLQERTIVRVGSTQPVPCDARVITATNRDLKHMVIDGLFREDLFYRVSVFPIELPSLRQRREDIAPLAEHFADRARRECGIRQLRIAPEAMDVLTGYDWPGNIRELQNVVERSVLMSDGEVLLPCHLPPDIYTADTSGGLRTDTSTLYGQERALILKALEDHNWNQSQAARALGITRYHIRYRIKKYGINNLTESSQSPQCENRGMQSLGRDDVDKP